MQDRPVLEDEEETGCDRCIPNRLRENEKIRVGEAFVCLAPRRALDVLQHPPVRHERAPHSEHQQSKKEIHGGWGPLLRVTHPRSHVNRTGQDTTLLYFFTN